MRRVSILLVVLLLISIGCAYFTFSNPINVVPENLLAKKIRAKKIALFKEQADEILKVALSDMPKVLDSAYRLRPDKRFLFSLREIHQFFSKRDNGKIGVQFMDDQWVVFCQDKEVGRLPEFPEFSDFLTLISNWSKKLNKEFPLNLAGKTSPKHFPEINQDFSGFLVPQIATGLQKINTQWVQGNRDPHLLKLAAQSLVRISLQSSYQLELSDLVQGKALAILGIARSLTAFPMKREEALLAWVMDYSDHAERVSRKLDQSDPIKMLIMKQDFSLENLARLEDSSTETKFLWLVRLAQKRQMGNWKKWVVEAFGDTELPLSVLKTGLEMKSFAYNQFFTGKMQEFAINELSPGKYWAWVQSEPVKVMKAILVYNKYYQVLDTVFKFDPAERNRMDRLESELETVDKKYSGPFLDANTIRSYYRGHYYSSVFVEGLHYLDSLSDINGARRFAENMQERHNFLEKQYLSFKNDFEVIFPSDLISNNPPYSPGQIHYTDFPDGSNATREFVNWFHHLVSVKENRRNSSGVRLDLLDIKDLGVPALYETYKSLISITSIYNSRFLSTIKQLAWRLDSRNNHKRILGDIAVVHLTDLKLAEKLYRSVEASSPSNYAEVLTDNAYRSRDDKQLFKHLQSPHLSSDDKSDILFQLYSLNPDSHPLIEKEYQRLLKMDTKDFGLNIGYAGFLIKKKKYEKARKLISDWQKLKLVTPGLEHINAQTVYARSYYKEGRYEEAWTEISKVVEGQKGNSLKLAGEILNKLDRLEDAEYIFRFSAERYSSHIGSLMPLIKFLWEHDRGLEAAKLLKGFKRPIPVEYWKKKIGETFSEIFGSLPVEKGEQAFSQLIQAGFVPLQLKIIPPVVFKNGNPELAFKMQSQLLVGGWNVHLVVSINGYQYIKAWKGEAKALEWLKKVVPPQAIPHASKEILSTKEFGLLWSFIETPNEYDWLARATGYVSQPNLSEKNKKKLFAYFKSPGQNPHYHIVGRYMLGMVTEQELLNAADTPKKRCEYSYFIALKAQMEGDYEKASDWYRIVMETGQAWIGEYLMAVEQLMEWERKHQYLSELKEVES